MTRVVFMVSAALVTLACETTPPPVALTEKQPEQATRPPQWTPPQPEDTAEQLGRDGLPPIPGQLLEKLEIEREGSFTLPAGADELTPRAAVVLGDSFALVGDAHAGGGLDRAPETWRWFGVVGRGGQAGTKLGPGSIHAAISDEQGEALLAGHIASGRDARAWFGTLTATGAVTRDIVLDGETPAMLVDVLASHEPEERALVLGNIDGQGWLVSLDARGAVRWQRTVSSLGATQLHAAARLHVEHGDVLGVGTRADIIGEAWWSLLAGSGAADAELEQGKFEIEGADPDQTLDAIVDLGDVGLLALGRAKRRPLQGHDQVIAVGFDRTGTPTWSRVLEHFRAIEIYGGAAHPKLPGVANFVLRIPIGGGEDRSALAWLDICPGMDGILIPRQLAGTQGWSSAGFIEGREGPAILTYVRTEAGIDWRVLPLHANYRHGWRD